MMMKIELELNNYTLDEFFENVIDVESQMNISRYQYSAKLNEPVRVELKNLGIDKRTTEFSSGGNTWIHIEYVNQFGVCSEMMVNQKVFSEMPWTVWVDSGDRYYPRWCGQMFDSEDECQKWIDENDS